MGHESAALALEVYSNKVMERKRDTRERMDALVQCADWARMGTNGANVEDLAPALANRKPWLSGASIGGRYWARTSDLLLVRLTEGGNSREQPALLQRSAPPQRLGFPALSGCY
jgi:hypothetical protein